MLFNSSLFGTYEHNLDGKNRVFVPAKFREQLGEEFVYRLYSSNYPVIQLYNRNEFNKKVAESLEGITDEEELRDAIADKCFGAGETNCDSQGRIVINPAIAKEAGIEKQCVFVGFYYYVEVMSPETYKKYLASIGKERIANENANKKEREIRRTYKAEGRFISVPDNNKG